ncbi:MAG: amidohydrolase family protein [Armatimonadota bacterium]
MQPSAVDVKQRFDEARAAFRFFDSNVWIGPWQGPAFSRAETIDELLSVLKAAYVEEALVSHFASVHYDPWEGNRMLLDALEDRDGLWGAIVLTPDGPRGCSVEDCIRSAVAGKARAARMFPRSHSFSIQQWQSGPLLHILEQCKLPLILHHAELSWSEIRSVCLAHPGLPVVVEGTGKKILYDNRVFYQALADCPNLHLELHNLVNYLGLEDLVARFGPERLIYGSYVPVRQPGAAQMIVTHARISEEAGHRIAGDNFRRLISEVVCT